MSSAHPQAARIVDECYAKTLDLLACERRRQEALAGTLLREESLNETQMCTVVLLAIVNLVQRGRVR